MIGSESLSENVLSGLRFQPKNAVSPVDQRIERFLADVLKDAEGSPPELPRGSLILDKPGLARLLSLPARDDEFSSEHLQSYRTRQGILHNPKSDRRTTQGVFHIVEGGLPIPDDKIAVPKAVFKNLLGLALNPPGALSLLPYTSQDKEKIECFVSLLLRPVVCPEVEGFIRQKSMEVRFFAPASLIANLDFVESIFGNGGDPTFPENDSGLDPQHWTGHTGCVILAPHLCGARKKDVGLPHESRANDRQRRDGMFWKNQDELYNGGTAFKVTCRDKRGVIVTVIADNYFGYCKKEVKTQVSYSANLFGFVEEEHAGGAIAFASFDLGGEYQHDERYVSNGAGFGDVIQAYGDRIESRPEGYGVDKKYPSIVYVPEDAYFNLDKQSVSWKRQGAGVKIKLLLGNTYILPSGYKVHVEPPAPGSVWRLIGTLPEGTLCHKPCTVSGGGKSEISKSLRDSILEGPLFISHFKQDMDQVSEILARDFGNRFRDPAFARRPSRPILGSARSLGSVIKLFTPSLEYTDEYNAWLKSIPPHIRDLIFLIKRHYRPEWGNDWRKYFSVDTIDGHQGHELNYGNRKVRTQYLRVGLEKDGSWRIYKLRQDFSVAAKVQVEDDITASVIVPRRRLSYPNPRVRYESMKVVHNCETRLFQRPDEAIHRGHDRQAERDLTSPGAFLSNFEPLTLRDAKSMMEDAIGFSQFTEPVRRFIEDYVKEGRPRYFVSPAHPRIFEGKPSKNPRYLQNRPDLVNHRDTTVAETAARLYRRLSTKETVQFAVNAILTGRRLNLPDRKLGIPALAVYNPIHYQELPELFMDFICSVTGKSPSTTGFGSEGALTKGPFNALPTIVDLNNALVGFMVTGYGGFSSAAGHVGPRYRVDHDISLLVPEIWCRMRPNEQEPDYLIQNGYLERVRDFEFEGKTVRAGILGWRITQRFVRDFLGRIFSNPHTVFNDEMLKPEAQGIDLFAEGVHNLVETQKGVTARFFDDGSIEWACPPLKALFHIMRQGSFENQTLESPDFRRLFTKKYLLESDWYRTRLSAAQAAQRALWERHIAYLQSAIPRCGSNGAAALNLPQRLEAAKKELETVLSPDYLPSIEGTIGCDPALVF